MKISRAASILSLSFLLAGPIIAQQTCAPTNDQARRDAKVDAQQNHRVDKAQSKADKADAKALHSKKVKKAARQQDKANAEAQRTPQ